MSDSYHELMSHLFNSPSNIPKSSYQLTGITHCRVANNSRSAARSSGLPAYAVVDWSEGREGRKAARSTNLPTYAKQRRRCIDTMQDMPRKNHAKVRRYHEHTIMDKEEGMYHRGTAYKEASSPWSQPSTSIERSKLSLSHTLARFLWHRHGLLCTLKTSNWFERHFPFL